MTMPEFAIGQTFGRYQIEGLPAPGQDEHPQLFVELPGLDTNLELPVTLQLQVLSEAEWESFRQAARAAARVEAPGLVRVLDFGYSEPIAYLVTEAIEGLPLAQLLQDMTAAGRRLPLQEVAALLRQAGQVLTSPQAQRLPDLYPTPATIKLTVEGESVGAPGAAPGEAAGSRLVLTDLGVFATARRTLQPAGETPTPPRSPQARQMEALGALLYALLTGSELAVPMDPTTGTFEATAVRTALTDLTYRYPTLPPPVISLLQDALCGGSTASPAPSPEEFVQAVAHPLTAASFSVVSLAEQVAQSRRRAGTPAARPAPVPAPDADTHEPVPVVAAPPVSVGPTPAVPSDPAPAKTLLAVAIDAPDGTRRIIPLAQPQVGVGRAQDSDIPIQDPRASRHHLRLEVEGPTCSIVDLGSTNGSFVDEQRLPPNVGHVWRAGEVLRIGAHRLTLTQQRVQAEENVVAAAPPSVLMPPLPLPEPVPSTILIQETGERVLREEILTHPDHPDLGLYPLTQQLQVEPGQGVEATLAVLNFGQARAAVHVGVEGVPPPWVQLPGGLLWVEPGGQAVLTLPVTPLRAPLTRAGRYRLAVKVASRPQVPSALVAQIDLRVNAYYDCTWEITPAEGVIGEPITVAIRNQGNATGRFVLQWWDLANHLNFDPPSAEVVIPSGSDDVVILRAQTPGKRWLGGAKRHVIQFQLASESGVEPLRDYTIIERSRVGLG